MPQQLDDLEETLLGVEQNHGDQMAIVCRGLIWHRQAHSLPIDDFGLILDLARDMLDPYAAAHCEAQAELPFKSRISIRETDD